MNLLYLVKIHTGGMDFSPGFGERDFGLWTGRNDGLIGAQFLETVSSNRSCLNELLLLVHTQTGFYRLGSSNCSRAPDPHQAQKVAHGEWSTAHLHPRAPCWVYLVLGTCCLVWKKLSCQPTLMIVEHILWF